MGLEIPKFEPTILKVGTGWYSCVNILTTFVILIDYLNELSYFSEIFLKKYDWKIMVFIMNIWNLLRAIFKLILSLTSQELPPIRMKSYILKWCDFELKTKLAQILLPVNVIFFK